MSERKLNVRLLARTENPEVTTALGGRLCYSDSGIEGLREAVAPKAEQFVDKLVGLGHLSPIEHASFTFGVEGVSRALLAQITRHRIASFSVQSQRYVKKGQMDYVLPPSVAALGEEAAKEFDAQMQTLYGFYEGWLARGLAAEDARFLLPNAAETRMLVTMNARELMHFFELRCCSRAQWEIRRLAWCMLGIVMREAPALFRLRGPGCVGGGCPEGKMSCGRAEEIRALQKELFELAQGGASDEALRDFVLERVK